MRAHWSIAVFSSLLISVDGCGLGRSEAPTPGPVASPAERTPTSSDSLRLDESWVPPPPTHTALAQQKPRAAAPTQWGAPTPRLSLSPSDDELLRLPMFPEPLRPVSGAPVSGESQLLAAAISSYLSSRDAEETAPLEAFAQQWPGSRWAPTLLLNLALIDYRTGHFSRTLEHARAAFEASRRGSDPVSQEIAARALAEYAKMNARVGRTAELDRVLAEAAGMTFQGEARVALEGAIEGRYMMDHKPGVSFRCGPYALLNLSAAVGGQSDPQAADFLARAQSPATGFSLAELLEMAPGLGLNLQAAQRDPGAALITPAVIHWSVGHFAALLDGGQKLLVRDPTFGNQTYMSRAAIDAEASGYFLVPAGPLPLGWRAVSASEAALVFGKGHTGTTDPFQTGPEDDHAPDDCRGPGPGPLAMARYTFHILLASLSVTDSPVSYDAPIGPGVRVDVTYNQRESGQPASMHFTNFGPQWVSNWISYVEDNPSSPNADVTLRTRGGGGEVFTGYSSGTGLYTRAVKTGAQLQKLTANTYKKTYSDGREEY